MFWRVFSYRSFCRDAGTAFCKGSFVVNSKAFKMVMKYVVECENNDDDMSCRSAIWGKNGKTMVLPWFCKIVTVKSTLEISQNFVAFSEYMNFNKEHLGDNPLKTQLDCPCYRKFARLNVEIFDFVFHSSADLSRFFYVFATCFHVSVRLFSDNFPHFGHFSKYVSFPFTSELFLQIFRQYFQVFNFSIFARI